MMQEINPSATKRKESTNPLRGSDLLLGKLHSEQAANDISAFTYLQRLMTFKGRIPYYQAVRSLTGFERRLVDILEEQPQTTLTPLETVKDLPDSSCLIIQEGHVGHVSILMPSQFDNYALSEPLHVAGALQFSPEQFKVIEDIKREEGQKINIQVKEAEAYLTNKETDGDLQPILENIHENLIRIGPTFLHVGHQIYSTFDRVGKNVVDVKPDDKRLLSEISKKPVAEWTSHEKIYVYGAHLLLASYAGPRAGARMEEFNGAQLVPDALREFFDQKISFYCNATGTAVPEYWEQKNLEEKAKAVGEKMSEVDQTHLRYRKINGLNLRQEEWILGPKEDFIPQSIPENLLERMNRVFGVQLRVGEAKESYWRRVTGSLTESGQLPFLIWSVVSSAAEATNSDFAMTSSFRDARQLLTEGALALKKQDFFCAVAPSENITHTKTSEEISEAMRLMSARMEYNRWHFIPANLPREQIPSTRDWFGSPLIPDLATEVDFHHGGHIETQIHHSIRYPKSVFVGGREYKGAYDIRLARQSGQEFTPSDIITAGYYLDALGNIYQNIIQTLEDTDKRIRIEGFNADWYNTQMWQNFVRRSGL